MSFKANKKCGAKTRAGGECRQPAMRDRERCRKHGGKAKRGAAHHRFKYGHRSRFHFSHERLGEIYDELLASGYDPYSADEDLRLLKARQLQLLESGESRELWKEAERTWAEFKKAVAAKDLA